jgi:hypothetical protein
MAWLDSLFGGGTTGGVDILGTLSPRQLSWFASKGIDPRTLSPQALGIAVQTMNSQFANEDTQAKALADQQAKAQADAEAKAQADALAAANAKAEEDARLAQQQQQQQPVTPPPTPTPPTDTTTQPVVETNIDPMQHFADLRNTAKTGVTSGVDAYFKSRGADPTQFRSPIDAAIAAAVGKLSPTDEDPASRLDTTGIASSVYGTEESNRRAGLTSQLQQMFPETFANTRVTNDLGTNTENQILSGQRSSADAIIQNMLARGVITPTGANAARSDLDRQTPIVKTRLDQIGGDLLSSERNSINDIISRANKTASTVNLGGSFDPNAYKNEIDQSFNDFVNSLDTKFRAGVPGNLYATTGLGAIAGSAQGAGNTKFNPNALAGVLEQQTNDANSSTNTNNANNRVTDFVF